MITVISRFKVANGKSEEVNQAFRDRPRLVESAPGFRDIAVLRDTNDASIFYLYTKWENLHCYRTWHASPAHDASHSRIPKGLKLDASFTQIEIFRDEAPESGEATAGFVEAFVSESDQFFQLHLGRNGAIKACSPSFITLIGLPYKQALGSSIADFLVASDASLLLEALKTCDETRNLILNFVDSEHCPVSVRARVSIANEDVGLIAERDTLEADNLSRQLIDLNNELTRLTREIQQKNYQLTEARDRLAHAIEERDKSYWFIKKIRDVLPICLGCHKVKPSGTTWEDLEEFLQNNTNFLSHGYCPECLAKYKAENL